MLWSVDCARAGLDRMSDDEDEDVEFEFPVLYFTAGPEDESHGLFGFINATPPKFRPGRR